VPGEIGPARRPDGGSWWRPGRGRSGDPAGASRPPDRPRPARTGHADRPADRRGACPARSRPTSSGRAGRRSTGAGARRPRLDDRVNDGRDRDELEGRLRRRGGWRVASFPDARLPSGFARPVIDDGRPGPNAPTPRGGVLEPVRPGCLVVLLMVSRPSGLRDERFRGCFRRPSGQLVFRNARPFGVRRGFPRRFDHGSDHPIRLDNLLGRGATPIRPVPTALSDLRPGLRRGFTGPVPGHHPSRLRVPAGRRGVFAPLRYLGGRFVARRCLFRSRLGRGGPFASVACRPECGRLDADRPGTDRLRLRGGRGGVASPTRGGFGCYQRFAQAADSRAGLPLVEGGRARGVRKARRKLRWALRFAGLGRARRGRSRVLHADELAGADANPGHAARIGDRLQLPLHPTPLRPGRRPGRRSVDPGLRPRSRFRAGEHRRVRGRGFRAGVGRSGSFRPGGRSGRVRALRAICGEEEPGHHQQVGRDEPGRDRGHGEARQGDQRGQGPGPDPRRGPGPARARDGRRWVAFVIAHAMPLRLVRGPRGRARCRPPPAVIGRADRIPGIFREVPIGLFPPDRECRLRRGRGAASRSEGPTRRRGGTPWTAGSRAPSGVPPRGPRPMCPGGFLGIGGGFRPAGSFPAVAPRPAPARPRRPNDPAHPGRRAGR